MQRNNFLLTALVAIGLLGNSCTEMISNVDLPEVDPKLVLNAWIQPGDSIIRASLTHSYPVGKAHNWNDNPDVTDAVVYLRNGSQNLQLVYDGMERVYKAAGAGFSLVPGQACTISADAPGYPAVDGTTTIPDPGPVGIGYLGVKQSWDEDWGGEVLRYSFKLQDPPGRENYYRVMLAVSYEDDTSFDMAYYREPEYGSPVISDLNKDGEDILISFVDGYQGMPYYIKLIVFTTDEAYYHYHKSVYTYTGDDPFAEPVQIYSNINNGLGAIGSYRTLKKLIRLR